MRITGTGNSADTPTSTSSEAQAFYRQGLNYLHGYVWIEAAGRKKTSDYALEG